MQSIRTALRMTSAVRPGIAGRNVAPPSMVRAYHEKVIDHYSNPRNVGSLNRKSTSVGTGLVGAPACGDVIRLDIQVDEATGKITETRFKTFGCGSAIASSSYLTTLLKGKTLDEAAKISNTQIASELCLPPVKLHCSLLAEDAVTAAIKNYRSKRITPATDLAGTAQELPKAAMQA
ncbi:NifU-like N terminal domain-containing protein [Aspergillus cavernicola]|uniref:Iron-sulfur cluster assembly protein n=1 Tax=Aspergillus cavernicola TaxID=176166 RepID=A0ABR4I5Q2_9EURO